MHRLKTLLFIFALAALPLFGSRSAGQPGKGEPAGLLVVIDAAGKEHKLTTWKFTAGTTHLSWLAAPKQEKELPVQKGGGKKQPPKAKEGVGPEALQFTEGAGPPLKKGVLSYVLLENIRQIDFDAEKDEVTLRVARSAKAEEDVELKGITGYVAVNVLTIEVREDVAGLGERVTEFKGGLRKGGVKSVRFPSPKPAPALAKDAKPYVVTAADKAKNTHTVYDIKALYRGADGMLAPSSTLYFKETVKLDLAKVKKLAHTEGGLAFDVTLADDRQVAALVLLNQPPGEKTQLDGLLARVPAGWKIFPMPTIGELNAGLPKRKVDI